MRSRTNAGGRGGARYRRAVSVFAMAVAGLLGGIGAAAAQQTVVNFLGVEAETVFAPVIEGFEASNPDIDVRYQQVPFEDMNAAIESRVGQGDTGVDVFQTDTPRVPAYAARGYLVDLEAYRGEIEAAVSSPVAMNDITYDGKVYAFPMWTSTQVLYYNVDLLEKAGIPLPSAAQADRMTWEQVLDLARKAQAAGAKWGLVLSQIDRYYQLQPLFESAGGGPGLTGDGLLTPDIANDAWTRTAQWYADLFEAGVAPRGVASNQTIDLFLNGETAFFVSTPWSYARMLGVEGLRFGVAPHPYFEGGKVVTPTGSWALGLSPQSQNQEAALKFLRYASTTTEGANLTVAATPVVPVNKGAYEEYFKKLVALKDQIGPMADIITYELRDTAVSRPRTIGYVAFETVMSKVLSDLRNGVPVSTVLKDGQDQLASALARVR